MVKLSKAQKQFLIEVCAKPTHCVKTYKPGTALVSQGLANWLYDDDYSGTLCITPAGRVALQGNEQ